MLIDVTIFYQIGNFIGGVGDFNKRVLREFVSCHQFTHLNPLSALRQFLWSFRYDDGKTIQAKSLVLFYSPAFYTVAVFLQANEYIK